jgi:hypothetical protein
MDDVVDRARGGGLFEGTRDGRFICDVAAVDIAGRFYIEPYHRCARFSEGVGDGLADAASGTRHDGPTAGKKWRRLEFGGGLRRGPILRRLPGRHESLRKRLLIAGSVFSASRGNNGADGHYLGAAAATGA